MEIKTGMSYTSFCEVKMEKSAVALGSGDMAVFATPAMVALMENAAMLAIAPTLEDGMTTVGISISATHDKATAVGRTVEATATVVAVDGRKISFDIVAREGEIVIGEARHNRFIVNKDKFLSKL